MGFLHTFWRGVERLPKNNHICALIFAKFNRKQFGVVGARHPEKAQGVGVPLRIQSINASMVRLLAASRSASRRAVHPCRVSTHSFSRSVGTEREKKSQKNERDGIERPSRSFFWRFCQQSVSRYRAETFP